MHEHFLRENSRSTVSSWQLTLSMHQIDSLICMQPTLQIDSQIDNSVLTVLV